MIILDTNVVSELRRWDRIHEYVGTWHESTANDVMFRALG